MSADYSFRNTRLGLLSDLLDTFLRLSMELHGNCNSFLHPLHLPPFSMLFELHLHEQFNWHQSPIQLGKWQIYAKSPRDTPLVYELWQMFFQLWCARHCHSCNCNSFIGSEFLCAPQPNIVQIFTTRPHTRLITATCSTLLAGHHHTQIK